MYRIAVIFFLLVTTRVFISCCKDAGFNFRWSKASITNIDVSTNSPTPLQEDSSEIVNYGFRLTFEYEKLAAHIIKDFGINKTFALSCESEYTNKDSVLSIEVITQNKFDNTHPAGSSLNEYLLTRVTGVQIGPAPPRYDAIEDNVYYINLFENSSLDFKFKPVSPVLGQHTFIISVLFESGRILSESMSIKFY